MSQASIESDFLLKINAADMDLHASVDGVDDMLTLLDVGSVDGGAMLGASVDDLDLSFLSELLHQGEDPVPEPTSPLSTMSSKNLAVVSSPSGRSDTTESSSDDDDAADAPEPTTPLVVHKAAAETTGEKKAEDRKAKRRAQVAISARRHRSRKKNEMINLKKEANYLNYQLDFLRSKHKLMRADGAVAEWEEKAIAQRHKRRQAEELNAQLRYALFQQSGYVKNLKAMFSLGLPAENTELNMRRFLHTYTHLRKDPQSRARESVCTDAKLELGMQTVLRETEGIPVLRPHISTRQISTSSTEFGASTVAVYAFDTMNTVQIFLAACGAILGCGSAWPKYTQLDSYGKVVDSPSDSVRYGVSGCRYRSDDGQDEVAVESRGLSYFKIMDRCAVLLWDYADDDDLYPMNKNTLVKRDVIGTVVVRPEICEDGVERVVCRSICTKVHSASMTHLSPDIRRFSESKKMGAQICGSMVYQTIVGHCPDARPISA
ncbi:hypothetical protein PR001_g514 [Phytophthora rubi]|uniref:BZIP domain-containing protein n=1 Tax=Phytophthora rubi TaxID=129364 RepID=A0A6A3PCD5_9STRA|nr:hypothetical protein PR002_g541 [Phytophthora rubi]KAE9052448.1 hypothetical protein PR001_g514 [Phytophthora rubi]